MALRRIVSRDEYFLGKTLKRRFDTENAYRKPPVIQWNYTESHLRIFPAANER